MFTHDNLRRASVRARTEGAWWFFLAFLFSGVLAGSWTVLAWWTDRPTYRTLAVSALSDRTRVIALGSSHLDIMLDPREIEVPMMSLPCDICNYLCMESVLHGHIDRLPGLEVVLVEMDIVPLIYDTLEVNNGDYRQLLELRPDLEKLQVEWHRRLRLWWERAFFDSPIWGPLLARTKLTPSEIHQTWKERREGPPWPLVAGHRGIDTLMTSENDGDDILAIHAAEGSLDNVPANTEALVRLVGAIRRRGLEVVLVRYPHHRTYWEQRPAAWNRAYDAALNRLRAEYGSDSLVYWDLEKLDVFPESEFRDGDHLNARGARRFSKIMNSKILELLGEVRK